MGDVIDELKVQIDASTKNADAKLDKFIDRMLKLQSAITGLEMSNASGVASGINQIANAVQNFNTRNKTTDFTRIASGLNRIAGVDAVGVSNTARAMKTFADGMSDVGMVNIDVTKLNEAVSVVTRLGGKNAGNAVNNLPQITKHLQQFVVGMNSAGALSFDFNGLNDLVNNISKLGGKKATQAASNLKPIKEQILRFVSGLNGIGALNFDTTGLSNLVSSITKLGGKGATNAIPNIQQLGTALSQLMSTLSKAPAVSQNLIQMTNALAALAGNGNRVGTAANSVSKGLGFYSTSAKNATKHSFSLASAIGKVYATYWMLFRALGLVRKSMDISSDLTEVQNVVDVTFGNMRKSIEDFADTSLTAYGMSELMAKKIASRFQAMGIAMGLTQKRMSGMSIELTKLAADMASFYNVSQEEVAKSLQSIFTGETEPMRKYGLDLSQTTLKEWALNNGLNANIKSMSIAQKTMLRYQYVMASSAQVMGDFARTSGSWHNQLVLLTGSFQTLGSIVGGTLINAFKPLLSALNTVMVKVIQFAEVVSNALGAIFGWKYETGGGFTDDFSGAADSADDLAGSTGEAAKNTKKMAENLQKFDKLNVISSQKDSDGSGGGAGSGGAGTGSGTGGQWVAAESLWEKYTSSLDSLYKLGDYIGDTLTQAMEDIDWNQVYQKAESFGNGLADFLNGLISPELFGATGKTIVGSLNTALHFLDSFGTTFDWTNFGKSIASGINGFFKNFDFRLLGKTLNTWVKGILDAMIEAVDGTNWKLIGSQIGVFLTELDLTEIGTKVGKLLWNAINAGIDLWKSMFDAAPVETAIITAVGALKFSGLGAIIVNRLVAAISSSFSASAVTNTIMAGFKSLLGNKAAGSALVFMFPKTASVVSAISTFFSGTLIPAITGGISALASAAGISVTAAGASVLAAVVAAVAGIVYTVTHWEEVKQFWTETIPAWWNETALPFFQGIPGMLGEVWDNVTSYASEKWESFLSYMQGIPDKIRGIVSDIGNWFGQLPEKIGYGLGYALGAITAWGLDVGTYLSQKIPEVIENVRQWFSELPEKIYNAISTVCSKIVTWGGEVYSSFNEKVTEIKDAVVTWFSELPQKIYDTIIKIREKITLWKTQTIEFFRNEVPQIVAKVVTFFEELPGKILEVGENVVRGLWNGINNMVDWLGTNITSFVNGVINGFKEGFDEHSPSKEAFEIGDYFTIGLMNGITDKFSNIYAKVDDFANKLSSYTLSPPWVDPTVHINRDILDTIETQQNMSVRIQTSDLQNNFTGNMRGFFDGIVDYEKLGEAVYKAQCRALQENPVTIGDDDVFNASRRAQLQYYKRTKTPGFVF